MEKPKYLITNLVYGSRYTKLFTDQHLKSVLDDTNLPAITDKYDVEYRIFTDQETLRDLNYHPRVVKLAKTVKVTSEVFGWPEGNVNKYQFRYGLILAMVKASINQALAENALLTTWVADLVVAKEFFPRILSRIEQGHGGVFVVPLRSGAEAVEPNLNKAHGALEDKALCALGFECLHPLWTAAHWQNPEFTKYPFTLLWQGSGGLLARTFQPTPIVFRPKPEMLNGRCMIDGDIPEHVENPYWAYDWVDAPVIGCEPLICYFPPFANRPATTQFVADYAQNLSPSQVPYLKHSMYYPSKKDVIIRPDIEKESDQVVFDIIEKYERARA